MAIQQHSSRLRFLPTRLHGVIDYALSGSCVALPRYIDCGPRTATVLRTSGTWGVGYSLATDYPLGRVDGLSFPSHLKNETFTGALLIATAFTVLREEPIPGRIAVAVKGLLDVVGSVITKR